MRGIALETAPSTAGLALSAPRQVPHKAQIVAEVRGPHLAVKRPLDWNWNPARGIT
uniref:Uncharacterized protein n=1 Tax=Rhizophora mucronata TaxID=61149 RepID=A0A2P2QP81_RHIMU